MCEWGTTRPVMVHVLAEQSSTGYPRREVKLIDACIAPIVEALQAAGIDMRGSCCGHGKGPGDIILADGRVLVIVSPDTPEHELWRNYRRPETENSDDPNR